MRDRFHEQLQQLSEALITMGALCEEAISAADALAQLLARRDALGWVGSAVTGLTQAYLPSDQAGTGIRFVPVWLVETDAGSFFINGITREITAET